MNHLSQLSSLAQALNQETDSYTKSLIELQKRLNKFNLGIEVWVGLLESGQAGTPNQGTYSQTLLGYAKVDKGWGLAIKEKRIERVFVDGDSSCPYENDYDEGPAKLLLECSRELRILAAGRMERLLEALITAANDVIPTLRKARELAQSI